MLFFGVGGELAGGISIAVVHPMFAATWTTTPAPVRRLIVVLALIGGAIATAVFAGIGLDMWIGGCRGGSKLRRATLLVEEGHTAVESFLVVRARCPTGERELIESGDLRGPRRDPWGVQLFYTCLQTADTDDITARSAGPDRIFWTADDIVWPVPDGPSTI